MSLPLTDRVKWLAVAGSAAYLGGKLVMLSFHKGMQAFSLEPPARPTHPETPLGTAVAWTVAGAALAGLTKLLVRRGVARAWRLTGSTLPA